MWEAQFEDIMRQYIPFLDADEALDPDASLRDLGLDSMGIIEMMGALEAAYQVRFLDDMLNLQTFATPRTVWLGVNRLLEAVA